VRSPEAQNGYVVTLRQSVDQLGGGPGPAAGGLEPRDVGQQEQQPQSIAR